LAVIATGRYVDTAAFEVMCDGVVHQVDDETFDEPWIPIERCGLEVRVDVEPKTLVVAPLIRDRASDVGQVDGLAAVEAAFAAGEGEERVDERLLFAVGVEQLLARRPPHLGRGRVAEGARAASWARFCGSFRGRSLRELPDGLQHCFEFRHPSWFCEPVYRLLATAEAALVIGDDPQRPFQSHRFPAHWTYVRFHYGSRGRGGNYSAGELDEWAVRLRRWTHRGHVYAYFNNDWNAYAPRNASRLQSLLHGYR
jgi:Protein of unknown function DUF72